MPALFFWAHVSPGKPLSIPPSTATRTAARADNGITPVPGILRDRGLTPAADHPLEPSADAP